MPGKPSPKRASRGAARAAEPGEPGPPGAEAYLEAIYVLTTERQRVVAARVAEYLGVSAVSVSRALTRLERRGWLEARVPEIRLSPSGWQAAEAVVRRHRLAERWLADRLGLNLVEAHREAERLEHALSGRVEAALWEDLGRPATCPHGNPIPGMSERVDLPPAQPIAQAAPGPYVVDRIFEELEGLEELLAWIEQEGLVPGAAIEVEMGRDREGARSVRVAGRARATSVPPGVARRILIRPREQAGG
jgi:DtxR family Mn-dependent transcriptional regulator